MAGSLANHHHAIGGAPVDQWASHRNIALLLAQAAGLDALLQDSKLGGAFIFGEFRLVSHARVPVRGDHDDSEERDDDTDRDSRAGEKHASPLHDRCCWWALSRWPVVTVSLAGSVRSAERRPAHRSPSPRPAPERSHDRPQDTLP